MADQAKGENEVPWLGDIQQPPSQLPPEAPNLEPLLVDDNGNAITTLAAWKERRAQLRHEWLNFLNVSELDPPAAPESRVIAEDRPPGVIRRRIAYDIEPGLTTEAYLLMPKDRKEPGPAVGVFHSTVDHSIRQPAGIEGVPEKAFGLELARRGYTTICPRNFLWPDNHRIAADQRVIRFHRSHPNVKGMAKMLLDAQVALNLLTARPEVDPARVGAVGHSLGAKEVLYLAAFDERVKVSVSSEGGIGIPFSNWDAPWYLGETVRSDTFRRAHHELLALIAPRPFLLIGGGASDGDQSWPYIEAALPVYHLYGKPPRLGLFNHRQGHHVPPSAEAKLYDWIEAYL